MVSLEVASMVVQPGESLRTQFTLYVGLSSVMFFSEMVIESKWLDERFVAEMAIHGSKWGAVFKPLLYITVNRLKAV